VGPDFAIMFDRTAQMPGVVWDYNTGLRMAREVDIPITRGEGFRGLDGFRECLVHDTYDILQPDCVGAGGIFTVRRIAAMAEAFHKPAIMHGAMGLRLAGWLQTSAAIGSPWQELALVTPPLLPEEQWSPALKVVNGDRLFTFRDGEVQVPQGPGLGLDINEDALERYRVAPRV